MSCLRAPAIRALVDAGDLQLGLFDETNLAEITAPAFPGERLVVQRAVGDAAQGLPAAALIGGPTRA